MFVPVLVQMSGGDVSSGGVLLQSMTNSSHRELLGNMQKFHSQVTQALQQLTGDVTLQVDPVPVPARAAGQRRDTDMGCAMKQAGVA